MQFAKIGLALLVMVAVTLGSVGCTADEGFQKGVQDGVAGAITAIIKTPVEAWVKTIQFPAGQ